MNRIFLFLGVVVLFIQGALAYVCESDYVQYNGLCYKFIKTLTPYYDSIQDCKAENATLATIDNAFTNSFALNLAKNSSIDTFWFGLYCPVDKYGHIFCQWNDGTKYNYNNFEPGSPSTNYVNVAFITSSGYWRSVDGLTKRAYLCAKDAFGFTHPITTLPPTLAPPVCQEEAQIYHANTRRHGTVEFFVLNLDFGSYISLYNGVNDTKPFHEFNGGFNTATSAPQQLYQSTSNQMKIVFVAADAGRYNNVTIYSWEVMYGAGVPL